MKSALAIQCLPFKAGKKEEAYALVDLAIGVIDSSGLPYMVGPMETVVEGPLEKLFEIAQNAHRAILSGGAERVATYMKLFSGPELGSSEEKVRKYREKGH
jgi:uncharacterized protein YqgV (UPF0045/DUF77 family)